VLLTITTTQRPATDLGFLLHKNPDTVRSVDLGFGRAHVVYPEATEDRCSAALLVEIDPIGLVRRRGGPPSLHEYVNDRPYVASSFLSVAVAKLYGTAMRGRSAERQALADSRIPLTAHIPVLPAGGGEGLVRRLFGPLGYRVDASPVPLDDRYPEWGPSRYYEVTLEATTRLRDLLAHLYVLLPVLDDEKHYWVERSEIDKLLRRGEDWLAGHPERDLIVRRYLRHRGYLTREALARLVEEDQGDPDAEAEAREREEDEVEGRIGLRDQRLGAVVAAVKASGARSVVDLGCGSGPLLQALLKDRQFERIVGVDVSWGALGAAARRLGLDRMAPTQLERIDIFQGSLTYRDRRLNGFDAAVLMEVIEHVDPDRLPALERGLFGDARPVNVIVTTPNREYNVRFEQLPAGTLRHRDHRFEWTRPEFAAWARRVAERHRYRVRFLPVGPEDAEVGAPTQMGLFEREDRAS
jgi:3' terminal RNA ribose 2'-O-methyltransferase Hen1